MFIKLTGKDNNMNNVFIKASTIHGVIQKQRQTKVNVNIDIVLYEVREDAKKLFYLLQKKSKGRGYQKSYTLSTIDRIPGFRAENSLFEISERRKNNGKSQATDRFIGNKRKKEFNQEGNRGT